LHKAGIVFSVGTVRGAWNNASLESSVGLCKTELIDSTDRSRRDSRQVGTGRAEYVDRFANDRVHGSIGMLAPVEYEALCLLPTAFPEAEVA